MGILVIGSLANSFLTILVLHLHFYTSNKNRSKKMQIDTTFNVYTDANGGVEPFSQNFAPTINIYGSKSLPNYKLFELNNKEAVLIYIISPGIGRI
jgi:hypothetical protein